MLQQIKMLPTEVPKNRFQIPKAQRSQTSMVGACHPQIGKVKTESLGQAG